MENFPLFNNKDGLIYSKSEISTKNDGVIDSEGVLTSNNDGDIDLIMKYTMKWIIVISKIIILKTLVIPLPDKQRISHRIQR